MTDVRQLNALVSDAASGMRLDQVLAKMFPEYSRSRLKSWVKDGLVKVDGRILRPRDAVYGGQRVDLEVIVDDEPGLAAEAIPLAILYQDPHLLIVNKPVGLVVHPGAGNATGTLVNGLLHYDPQLNNLPRAGLIHRLDKDTSGVLVIARTLEAHTLLSEAMQTRKISRAYLAVCVGRLTSGGTIDAPIGRHTGDRTKMTVKSGGREAVTHYRIMARYRGNSLLSIELETGRTHQIRVHFAHQGHPLVGDRTYGRPSFPRGATQPLRDVLEGFQRQALHAVKLEFNHPVSGELISVSAQPPADFQELCEALEKDAALVRDR